jgi:hypothetical protein
VVDFERFFRAAAGLDVDKEDLRRYGDCSPSLERLPVRPQLDLSLGEETEARLPAIADGLSVAVALAFDHRLRRQEPPDGAVGTGLPPLRPAALE